ncbi:2-succinyl-5-enolpyruvyl-6-hydroxy-3-cyclohexene-1-carboxylic-acid synthase [Peribacillus huizhouensis]|uniref:2-succinyl-5-enolpyruvyl-6-hydroxy-3-cyclohexene-1-carboxylate synthase n=1 Tax=Peribacillus huizhouensis TaxID=1501239 RepID=A0ABR6CVI9_9BACI|nr:2-succinyl-5-enolpyruvyl-6-hydroxy-3-cyclohexene-1-carboxylic-acid synthase [Peribacillus huizhouensis]MBA9029042.1 2-succinyl-5-enolpyruvyl-6-hydroxy-3-cyclohexene-1-carboxylate synthase [Peribacillus huizhouensis]
MNDRDTLTAYVAAFVDELARNQINDVVVSPGSRSTPLALLLAEHPEIKIHINVDERSAAFFALGLAKAMKKPVAMLCTSGTATANYYPAIVEAFYSRVPLIVLTADRPHELRDVGAPQTINQIGMYGNHVKWFVEMALPESSMSMIRYARTICARAVATAANEPAGPVHLNFPLREPLIPNLAEAEKYRQEKQATVAIEPGALTLSTNQLAAIAKEIGQAKRGLIICGDLKNNGMKEAVTELGETLGFPILADPLSQLRSGQHSFSNVIDCYDTFLRDEQVIEAFHPDVILRFGAMPVSKPLLLWLKKQQAQYFVIDGGAGFRDPSGLATHMVYSEEEKFCRDLVERLHKNLDQGWLQRWVKVNEATKHALRSIANEEELDEGKLFYHLNELMPEHSHLFVGNSMPIRDLDTFFFSNNKNVEIYANRGANGIDGIVSTALGVSTVKEKTVLVIGDLSFFHDMNGLLAGKLQGQNLTILVINNDGGGIFSFLSQASEKEYFEVLFGTPHGLDFSHSAQLYNATYQKIQNWDEFSEVFTASFSIPGLKIIEIPTNRESNVLKHRNLWSFVSREIADALIGEIQ